MRDDPALGHLHGEALAHLRIQAAAMRKHVTTLRSLPASTERDCADEHYDTWCPLRQPHLHPSAPSAQGATAHCPTT